MPEDRKERERAELHLAIWNIANDVRRSVGGRDFKQYVLGMLFYENVRAEASKEDKREKVDIKALSIKIDQMVKRESVLRKEIGAIIAEIERDVA
jgi:type I restriction-modification system DNA methylase subunit